MGAKEDMQKGIEQIVTLLMFQIRREWNHGSRAVEGGLLVSVSAETSGSLPDHLTCTVAAAGVWCSGAAVAEVKQEVAKRLPSSVCLSPPADPEELSVFTKTCGSLHFHLSLQVEIHFILKVNETTSRQVFSCRPDHRFPLEGGCVLVDSTPCLRCPISVGPRPQCGRLHPVLSRTVSLLLPPEVAETGLCGETSLVPLATLSPCVAQYPNWATHLTRICISFT
ncbi:hypothetical protein MATL_G00166640 [Megalops atlanticus]|uniref:Uncharacterized protein n=1 Tax=Megalops atlanticus TaxID=7932 RepID=A0A9D3T2T2_MEGAT|nr:hypothetical protein MATL_G00166640 [Megalops atlanticus]